MRLSDISLKLDAGTLNIGLGPTGRLCLEKLRIAGVAMAEWGKKQFFA